MVHGSWLRRPAEHIPICIQWKEAINRNIEEAFMKAGLNCRSMELLSRRRWRLESAQVVSCCVYDKLKILYRMYMAPFHTCLTVGPIRWFIYFYWRGPWSIGLWCCFEQIYIRDTLGLNPSDVKIKVVSTRP